MYGDVGLCDDVEIGVCARGEEVEGEGDGAVC